MDIRRRIDTIDSLGAAGAGSAVASGSGTEAAATGGEASGEGEVG